MRNAECSVLMQICHPLFHFHFHFHSYMKISGYSSMFILHKKNEKSMCEARHLSFTNGFESNMLHFTRKGGILSETNNVKKMEEEALDILY